MPIIKSAKKALRQSIKRREDNRKTKRTVKDTLKKATSADVAKLYSVLDKAAKKNVIHPNKAARLKSRLTKKLAKGGVIAPVAVKKTSAKKAAAKKIKAKATKTKITKK